MTGQHSSIPISHYAFPHPEPSADTSFVKRKILDVPYAFKSLAQKLDIYLPDEGKKPTLSSYPYEIPQNITKVLNFLDRSLW
jgi:hypothetical protein